MKPVILTLGANRKTGSLVVKALKEHSDLANALLCSRRQEQANTWRKEGHDAVFLDLDKPGAFGLALAGTDRLFLLTGRSADMLAQSKTLVDAAAKAGVSHIARIGIFASWDCADPHFAWRQMVEKRIEASGIKCPPELLYGESCWYSSSSWRTIFSAFWR